MEKSGFGIIHDVIKAKREVSEFPILCETCLGEAPYVRMVRLNMGKECQICSQAYSGFRWRAGTGGRFKTTVICQSCARGKNVCQTCLFDLMYGLPVQVRDRFLQEISEGYSAQSLDAPRSQVGRDYAGMYQLGDTSTGPPNTPEDVHQRLMRFARHTPYYRRNKPRICTFWQRGECTRGAECPFAHEEEQHDDSLANQNIRDRFHGKNDPVAQKLLRISEQRDADGIATLDITPPENLAIKSLFIQPVDADVSEVDVHQALSVYGPVVSIRVVAERKCAFVTFKNREDAESCISGNATPLVKGRTCQLSWTKGRRGTAEYASMNPVVAELRK